MSAAAIFVVDDEASIRSTLAGILQEEGYQVATCNDSIELKEKMERFQPRLILLDIWLPGEDGLEILSRLRQSHPEIPVIMMSGHAGIESAVHSIKLGAYDFLEKPLHLAVLLDKVASAMRDHPAPGAANLASDTRLEFVTTSVATSGSRANDYGSAVLAEIVEDSEPQRTIGGNVVLNGKGLLSGRNTGIILSPLGVGDGIVFQTLDGIHIRGNVTALENYGHDPATQSFSANSTTLINGKKRVRTVEHILATLHMYGITNILIKTDEEIPNIDGSAIDFCRLIEEAGVVEQHARRKKIVIRDRISVGNEHPDEKYLYCEPAEGFEVKMRVHYPPPIGEQSFHFKAREHSFAEVIAPARSFNTIENIDTAQKMGRAGGGYINSHIILHNGKVINTELHWPDEFVRHKILDLIGDLYLLGMPIEGRFIANMTSHGYNQAIALRLHEALTGMAQAR